MNDSTSVDDEDVKQETVQANSRASLHGNLARVNGNFTRVHGNFTRVHGNDTRVHGTRQQSIKKTTKTIVNLSEVEHDGDSFRLKNDALGSVDDEKVGALDDVLGVPTQQDADSMCGDASARNIDGNISDYDMYEAIIPIKNERKGSWHSDGEPVDNYKDPRNFHLCTPNTTTVTCGECSPAYIPENEKTIALDYRLHESMAAFWQSARDIFPKLFPNYYGSFIEFINNREWEIEKKKIKMVDCEIVHNRDIYEKELDKTYRHHMHLFLQKCMCCLFDQTAKFYRQQLRHVGIRYLRTLITHPKKWIVFRLQQTELNLNEMKHLYAMILHFRDLVAHFDVLVKMVAKDVGKDPSGSIAKLNKLGIYHIEHYKKKVRKIEGTELGYLKEKIVKIKSYH